MYTCYSSAKNAVLYAYIHRWGQGPIEISNSDTKVAVLDAQNNRWGMEPT